jgi:hypothetical protein
VAAITYVAAVGIAIDYLSTAGRVQRLSCIESRAAHLADSLKRELSGNEWVFCKR